MYFSDDVNGKEELYKTNKIYNSHNNLTLIARENISYEMMKNNFINAKIIKCPDIVFYINNKLPLCNEKRTRIMTCLRSDKEAYIDSDDKNNLISSLENKYEDVLISDTVINNNVNPKDRELVLFKLWKDFYKSKVVITDRLHGMVFAAITRTPCIVTKSLDHKVIGTYEWISNLNYIKLVDNLDFENIEPIIEELCNLKQYTKMNFDKVYFNKLKDSIV